MVLVRTVELPVKTTLLQNFLLAVDDDCAVELPVKTTLLQNHLTAYVASVIVELPVKTTLLQNRSHPPSLPSRLNYQLKRHCSKTHSVQQRLL